jgi:23S rRNA (cytosine1962-C5)-methyltransferase
MEYKNLLSSSWDDYELIDSGDNKKLERYGKYFVIRPETQAIWEASKPEKWLAANARFDWKEGKGNWKNNGVPESWDLSWGDIKFSCKLTSFKHTGIFPEQSPNWKWLKEKTEKLESPEVLNLFGYTGLASIAAAKAGARVTHVDASKQSNTWAKNNAELSDVPENTIRYMLDDALRFCEREVRREKVYNGIILDPPAFGRGPKGEVWKIEEDLPKLLTSIKKLLSPKAGSFLLLNGYAAGYSPQSFLRVVENLFPKAKGQYGELCIGETSTGKLLPSGIYARIVI